MGDNRIDSDGLGSLLYRVRAGEQRSPLANFVAPVTITVSNSAFADGGPMPPSNAGKGVGDNISPPLHWTGLPPDTKQVALIIDDIDVALPRPLMHTIAVIEPDVDGVAEGALRPGSAGMRVIPGALGHLGYAGPARSGGTGHTTTGFMFSRSTCRFRTMSPPPGHCGTGWPGTRWPAVC